MFSAEQKKVYIQDADGKLFDAATGDPVAGEPPADLDNVHLNNRVRGALDAAVGQLTLLSHDPGKRYDAAQAVFKSRAESALPTVEKALSEETDSRVKVALRAGMGCHPAHDARHLRSGQAQGDCHRA